MTAPDTLQDATEEREALVKDMIAFGRLPVTTQCEGSCFGIGECHACTEACADAILAAGWRRAARPGAPPQDEALTLAMKDRDYYRETLLVIQTLAHAAHLSTPSEADLKKALRQINWTPAIPLPDPPGAPPQPSEPQHPDDGPGCYICQDGRKATTWRWCVAAETGVWLWLGMCDACDMAHIRRAAYAIDGLRVENSHTQARINLRLKEARKLTAELEAKAKTQTGLRAGDAPEKGT